MDYDLISNADNLQHLVGQKYQFDDGDSIEIVQIKRRDDGPWVTFHVQQGPGIPRKLLMRIDEFLENYGHLFDPTVYS